MPARRPKGDYVRDTGDIFRHARGRASAILTTEDANGIAVGLFNADKQSRICHILGVNIHLLILPDQPMPYPFGGAYYGALPIFSGGGTVVIPPTEAFCDLDGAPTGVSVQVGDSPFDLATNGSALIIPTGTDLFTPATTDVDDTVQWVRYWPPGEVAVFKQGRGFAVYTPARESLQLFVSFDFVMLQD